MSSDIRMTATGLEYTLSAPSGDPGERGFVMRSMTAQLVGLPGYRDLSAAKIRPYFDELERRWDDPTSVRLVARPPDDPWLILGFVLGGPMVVTWLHVRGGFRGLGLATDLALELGVSRDTDAVIEFPTWDLVRRIPGHGMPVGLLHNPRWHLTLVPWGAR